MPRHSAPQQPAWLRPRLVVTLAVATAGLATAIWLPTRNDSADAAERDRGGRTEQRHGWQGGTSPDSFTDDFDGAAGSTVDPQKWVLDTSRSDDGLQFSQSTRNARLDGEGNLLLTAREGRRSGLTSARLVSRSTFRRESGEVSARIQVSAGEGLRPAFELISAGAPGGAAMNLLAEPVADGFHTYAASWTAGTLTFSVDGTVVRQMEVPGDATDRPFSLALSLVVTDGRRAELPARMVVDAVNVTGATEPSAPPTTSAPTGEPTAPATTPPTTEPTAEPTTPPTTEPTVVPTTTAPPTTPPTTPPASKPAKQAWKPFTDYAAGQIVTFKGADYEVLEAHTSLPGWEPTALPSLFKKL
ncbi:family 16 glycosylhydrolase [Couchioplanes caeruleus]|uniref:carbohydrate-binding protein n=1 Tax=Couchioplanes caeruleus TaxID=56438 RepID=UPI00201C6B06|nr:carbohydrate-binding protein [Couchioplanes caeruleus]UQU65926.1 family 16 glycosylhydrolase [Couchioplanes caeruleus]